MERADTDQAQAAELDVLFGYRWPDRTMWDAVERMHNHPTPAGDN